MKDITKKYSTDEITIIWRPSICSHSAKCFHGLPQVFDPREKPWIKEKNASAEEIMKQIDICPSKALTYINHK